MAEGGGSHLASGGHYAGEWTGEVGEDDPGGRRRAQPRGTQSSGIASCTPIPAAAAAAAAAAMMMMMMMMMMMFPAHSAYHHWVRF